MLVSFAAKLFAQMSGAGGKGKEGGKGKGKEKKEKKEKQQPAKKEKGDAAPQNDEAPAAPKPKKVDPFASLPKR